MKTYWNRKETESVLGAFAAMECLREFKEGWGERGELTEEEAEKFGEAWERVNEGLTLMCERVDRGTQEKVLRSSSQYRVMLAPVEGRSFAVEAEKELGGECAYVTVEALSKLAELALEACCGPCICKGNQGACRARGAFLELEVPPFNENAADGVCPYEIPKEEWEGERAERLAIIEGISTERLKEIVKGESE